MILGRAAQGTELPTAESRGIRGPVVELTVFEQILVPAPEDPGRVLRERIVFHPDGRPSERCLYHPDGRLQWKSDFRYDGSGRLMRHAAFNSESESLWAYEYERDDHGRIVKEVSFAAGDEVDQKTTYTYVNDRVDTETVLDANGDVLFRKSHSYLRDGKEIRWTIRYHDGRLLKRVTEVYDDAGRLISESHTDELDSTFEKVSYEYDLAGRPVVIEVTDADGNTRGRRTLQYDRFGSIVLETETRTAENAVHERSHLYEYDEFGTWTTRKSTETVRRGDTSTTTRKAISIREIVYTGGR